MKNKKLSIIVAFLFILLCNFSTAEIVSLYDDFSFHNSTTWSTPTESCQITSGYMRSTDGIGASSQMFLIDDNYTLGKRDTWTIEYSLSTTSANGGQYANVGFLMTNNSNLPITYDNEILLYGVSKYSGQTAYSFPREYFNTSNIPSDSYASGVLTVSFQTWKWQKDILDDGTFSFAVSVNDVLKKNFTTVYNWSDSAYAGDQIFSKSCSPSNTNTWRMNWINVTIDKFLDEPKPVVDITNPLDNTRSNVQENITFTVDKVNITNFICDLYIDDIFNQTNPNVINNTETIFNINWSETQYTIQINCSDNESSGDPTIINFEYDATEPFIISLSPHYLNTTIYDNYVMDIVGNVTDNSLYRGNFSIRYPNSTLFYNNYTGNLPFNTSYYEWNWSFDTLNEPNGLWSFHLDWVDSHTAKYIKNAKLIEKNQDEKKLRYVFEDDTDISIQLIDGNVFGQFENITTNKLFDRYDFELNFKNTINPNSRLVFRISSNLPINILKDSEYPCHAVTSDYWIDFAGIDTIYETYQIDDYTYDCELYTKNPQDKIVFKSLGGLNANNQIIEFAVDNCIPEWSCIDFSICNTTDQQVCTDVIDNNYCGLNYTGDYSEFGDFSCDYCFRDISIHNQTQCQYKLQDIFYVDANFGSCCNITRLESDCYNDIIQNSSIVLEENISCSFFDYNEADISTSIINTIAKGMIFLIVFVPIIILVFILFGIGINKAIKQK